MLQAKAEAAGVLCGTGRAPRCCRAVPRRSRQQRGGAIGGDRQCSAVAKELCKQLRQSGAITMHAPIGVVLPSSGGGGGDGEVPGQGAGRAAPS